MTRGLTSRTLAASAALALVVGAAFTALLLAIGDLRGATKEAQRSDRILAGAHELERLVIDLQSSSRGFVITGDPAFLEPRNEARRRLPAAEAELRQLVRDPAQVSRLRTIGSAVDSYIDDYTGPLIALAEHDLEAARARVSGGEGKRRIDTVRALFAAFAARQEQLAAQRSERADASARRAVLVASLGLGTVLALVLLYAIYVSRWVVGPLGRVAAAAGRFAGGDFGVRVADHRRDEIGALGRAFNSMAASLEESRLELETQNAELEAQQVEIEAANLELEAQQGELERAFAELGEEKERLETLYDLAASLAAETELEPLSQAVLHRVCDAVEAELGTLYAADGEDEGYRLAAARGIDGSRLPPEIQPGAGLPGRALAERRPVSTSHGESGLAAPAFGIDVSVRHELHVPLIQGGRMLGVLTLARLGDRAFSDHEIEVATPLADQAGVALANAIAFAAEQRLGVVNRAVLDSTLDAIWLMDPNGKMLLGNAAFSRFRRDVLQLPEGERDLASRMADPDAYRARMAEIEADPELERVDTFQLVSGHWLERYTAPVHGASGALIGRIYVVRDVTGEREAEQLKSDLVATVSHELRTPLASILGFSELLATRDLDPATSGRYLGTIHEEARRLTHLVNDFLDLQRIEEGRLTLDVAPFDLGELLRHEVELFAGQSRAHTLSLSLPDEPVVAVGERNRIAQVVANLLSNAIKYSPEGGSVEVSVKPREGRVRVAVSDSGLGIPGEQQSRIFAKFFRVDTSDTRRIGGTGLGLALAREVVEAHGGRMGFESVEGRGSTFWFELPTAGAARPGRRHALVIADESAGADDLRGMLAADGFEVTVAATGEEGLALAANDPPSVVCLDVGVGGRIDGWEALARLKASPLTTAVPVIVCARTGDDGTAGALGATDVLVKPFSGDELRRTLARVMGPEAGSVLVVDDDPAVRALVVETLAGEALELREAADGLEALEAVAQQRPDAIVLDLVMPALDGFGVLDRLYEDSETRSIPVIVLTARSLSPEDRRRLSARAASLMEKGAYSAHELRQLVRRAVGDS